MRSWSWREIGPADVHMAGGREAQVSFGCDGLGLVSCVGTKLHPGIDVAVECLNF